MRIALHTPITASRKEPLAEMTARIRQAFLHAGLDEPLIRFTLTDSAATSTTSAIDRVLRRFPAMEQFVTDQKVNASISARVLSNVLSGEPADYATLEAIASGVPRSFPFPSIAFHLYVTEFGERLIGLPATGHSYPGVVITDTWWVSGRQRALSVYTVVEAAESDKKLPPSPPRIEALIKACGKAKKTVQVPILAPGGTLSVSIPSQNLDAVKAINAEYRSRIADIAAAHMAHVLQPLTEALTANLGVLAGPRKPALEAAFKPLGYGCTGGSGIFHLTRRTEANHTAELYLDVGTWSHSVSASFLVHGPGFRATLPLPIAPGIHGQYPIGDAAQWQKIVENLASLVRELERTFVPAIDAAAGPAPAWHDSSS